MSGKRVTISDIAARAGLSKGAVSYALNGLPGVSAATRARVLAIAAELDWSPNRTARALSGARSNAVGLVLARPARLLGTEPFYMEFIAGLEQVFSAAGTALMLQMVPNRERETGIHRSWWEGRQVDGLVVVDLVTGDERIEVLADLGIPAVVVGPPDVAAGFSCVYSDERTTVEQAVRYLFALGHRRIARVAGPAEFVHVEARTQAMRESLAALELTLLDEWIVTTDFSGEGGARAARGLLTGPHPPTAILFDNDVMAVAGLSVASELGLTVPPDVSLLAWDDSPLCRITHPSLSAMSRDVDGLGQQTARLMLDVLAGAAPAAHAGPPTTIAPRGSTGPPRR